MDKTERTIAKVTNAGRILSRIAWIFDLIACGCSAFLILAALLWWNTRPDLFTGYASQTGALLICAGDLIGRTRSCGKTSAVSRNMWKTL